MPAQPLFTRDQEVAVTIPQGDVPRDLVGRILARWHHTPTGVWRYQVALPDRPPVWVDEGAIRGVQAALPLEAPAE